MQQERRPRSPRLGCDITARPPHPTPFAISYESRPRVTDDASKSERAPVCGLVWPARRESACSTGKSRRGCPAPTQMAPKRSKFQEEQARVKAEKEAETNAKRLEKDAAESRGAAIKIQTAVRRWRVLRLVAELRRPPTFSEILEVRRTIHREELAATRQAGYSGRLLPSQKVADERRRVQAARAARLTEIAEQERLQSWRQQLGHPVDVPFSPSKIELECRTRAEKLLDSATAHDEVAPHSSSSVSGKLKRLSKTHKRATERAQGKGVTFVASTPSTAEAIEDANNEAAVVARDRRKSKELMFAVAARRVARRSKEACKDAIDSVVKMLSA